MRLLVRLYGVGPITTARVLGEVGDVSRFQSRQAAGGPGGHVGTTPKTSVTDPTPMAGSSVKPQPGPATRLRLFAPPLDRGVPVPSGEPSDRPTGGEVSQADVGCRSQSVVLRPRSRWDAEIRRDELKKRGRAGVPASGPAAAAPPLRCRSARRRGQVPPGTGPRGP
ncbi:MAG: transposase [Acidimicrobiales bacterium]